MPSMWEEVSLCSLCSLCLLCPHYSEVGFGRLRVITEFGENKTIKFWNFGSKGSVPRQREIAYYFRLLWQLCAILRFPVLLVPIWKNSAVESMTVSVPGLLTRRQPAERHCLAVQQD